MADKKHPGTAGLLPVKGSGCGIRPDPDALNDDTGFDFSAARQLLQQQDEHSTSSPAEKSSSHPDTPSPVK
ncbi:hypothetical protein [Thalassolituus hydrocarboniclasticus]|uniref:Uncharacterized protein n=1 Tax=Thalassolituus hydrocarboniclasticus TaxID=2742796 RepID=A0ABY6AB41_9GAMM|nr:hypothetical protein [Thalassolituus hydrocarboniclasticus]UXD87813.1 hypothetical protein HUF19_10355 [Thalassolituus hydrocarboniclasticus]